MLLFHRKTTESIDIFLGTNCVSNELAEIRLNEVSINRQSITTFQSMEIFESTSTFGVASCN